MEQSRVMSLVEVITGSVIAFTVSIWANWAVLPLFGYRVRLDQSFAITAIFTVISIARSYLVRRFFEVHVKRFAAWCQSNYDTNRPACGPDYYTTPAGFFCTHFCPHTHCRQTGTVLVGQVAHRRVLLEDVQRLSRRRFRRLGLHG